MPDKITLVDIECKSKNIDHHGLIAACCADLDIANIINKRIDQDAYY